MVPDFYARRHRWIMKLVTDPRIGPRESLACRVGIAIADRCRPDDPSARISMTTIMADVGCRDRTSVQRAINKLRKLGYLKVESGASGRQASTYNLNLEYSDNFRTRLESNSQTMLGSNRNPEENRKEGASEVRSASCAHSSSAHEKLSASGLAGILEIYNLAVSYGKEGNAGVAKIVEAYKKALAVEGATPELLHEGYAQHLGEKWQDTDYTGDFLVKWLQRVAKDASKTLGLEKSKPVATKKRSKKTRRPSAGKPEATTGEHDLPPLEPFDPSLWEGDVDVERDAVEYRTTAYTTYGIQRIIEDGMMFKLLTAAQAKAVLAECGVGKVSELDAAGTRLARDRIVATMESNFPDSSWLDIYKAMVTRMKRKSLRLVS